MAVVIDIEWTQISQKGVSLTQLSAIRVSKFWEPLGRFDAIIQPVIKEKYDCGWDFVAFHGHTPEEFQNGETEEAAVNRFLAWLDPEEDIYIWDITSLRSFRRVCRRYYPQAKHMKRYSLQKIAANCSGVPDAPLKSIYNTALEYHIPIKEIHNCSQDDVDIIVAIMARLSVNQDKIPANQPESYKKEIPKAVKEKKRVPAKSKISKSNPVKINDPPVFCSTESRNKIVHLPHCRYLARIPTSRRIAFGSLSTAREHGYRLCNCCPSIAVKYQRERKAISEFTKDKVITVTLKDGSLYIDSRMDEWMIITTGKNNTLALYHKNKEQRIAEIVSPGPIPGFHEQKEHSSTILGFLKSIVGHDSFRYNKPYVVRTGTKPQQQFKSRRKHDSRSEPSLKHKHSKKHRAANMKRDTLRRMERERFDMNDWEDELLAVEIG